MHFHENIITQQCFRHPLRYVLLEDAHQPLETSGSHDISLFATPGPFHTFNKRGLSLRDEIIEDTKFLVVFAAHKVSLDLAVSLIRVGRKLIRGDLGLLLNSLSFGI